MPDIFDEENMIKGNWVKFDNVGDNISGTYIGKRSAFNQLRGEDQNIYEILTKDGEIWNLGSKPAIDDQMRHIKIGQIVGFKYIAEGKTRPGFNPAKIIKVFARPDLLDKEWLATQDINAVMDAPAEDGVISDTDNDEPFPSGPAKPAGSDKKTVIEGLAKVKLGIPAGPDMERKVMETTGLAFIESNYEEIIKALESM